MSLAAYAIRDSADGCTLTVIAKPRARRTAFAGFVADAGSHDGALCVRLQAPPVNGKANEELIRFLAKQLGLPRTAVTLRRGATSRRKVIAVRGRTAASVARRIDAAHSRSRERTGE